MGANILKRVVRCGVCTSYNVVKTASAVKEVRVNVPAKLFVPTAYASTRGYGF